MKSKSGKGLSKRTDSFSIRECRKNKISPIVILNYLKKIGTNQPMEKFDNFEELVKKFDLNSYSRNSVFFEPADIIRLNSKFLKNLDYVNVKDKFNVTFNKEFWDIIKSNIDSIEEANDWYDILTKQLKLKEKIELNNGLKKIILESMPENINKEFWTAWTNKILKNTDLKPKEVFILLREILTGKQHGPSMNDLLTLIQKDEIIRRVDLNCEEKN